MSIEIRRLRKTFGRTVVCDDLDLDVRSGELLALLGPSGSGKTTLLRIVAGLELPDSGTLRLHGEDATRLDARERGVGFVFQHFALFSHLTVQENVAFGLRVRPRASRPSEASIRATVARLLALVQLEWSGERYPHQLSGGQRQRIALARALAVEPRLLLLDEPFGSLDAQVRKELRRWLRRLHDEMPITSVFVTHDQEEALEVADRVVVLNAGRIEQVGTPNEIWERPATRFVVDFLGDANRLPRRPEDGPGTEPVRVRPHDFAVLESARDDAWPATLSQTVAAGPVVRLEFRVEGAPAPVEVVLARSEWLELQRTLTLSRGSRAWLHPRATVPV